MQTSHSQSTNILQSKLLAVIQNPCNLGKAIKYQGGNSFSAWKDGDAAISQNHHNLLEEKGKKCLRMYYWDRMKIENLTHNVVALYSYNGLTLLLQTLFRGLVSTVLAPYSFPIVVISLLRALRLQFLTEEETSTSFSLRRLTSPQPQRSSFFSSELCWYFLTPAVFLLAPCLVCSAIFIPCLLLVALSSQVLGVAFILSPLLCATYFGKCPDPISGIGKVLQQSTWQNRSVFGQGMPFTSQSSTTFWLKIMVALVIVFGAVWPVWRVMGFIWHVFLSSFNTFWAIQTWLLTPLIQMALIFLPMWFILAPLYYSFLLQGKSLIPVLSVLCPLYGWLRLARVQPTKVGPMLFSENRNSKISVPGRLLNSAFLACFMPMVKYINVVEISAHDHQQPNENDTTCSF